MPDLARLAPAVPAGAARLLAARAAGPGDGSPVTVRYRAHATAAGATVLVPAGDRALLRAVLPAPRRTVRSVLVRAARAALPARSISVTGAAPAAPALLEQACPHLRRPRCALLLGGGGPRRRAVLLVAGPVGPVELVVKVGTQPGAAARGDAEQAGLRAAGLALPGAVPRPLGSGTTGSLAWSSETAVAGRPLAEHVAEAGARRTRVLLDDLAATLTRLAAATGTAPPDDDEPVRLRGPHTALAPLLAQVRDVPRVLVHGDLSSALNVLVDGSACRLVDWETAQPAGLPLLDLVPALLLLTAQAAGHRRPGAQAEHALALAAGGAAESSWLLPRIAAHCAATGVPLDRAGALAALALGHVASLPLVHDELLAAVGEQPFSAPPEESAASRVARAWLQHPALGTAWPALQQRAG